MGFQRLETKLDNDVLTITFTRPDQLNALDRLALEELEQVFKNLGTAKVVVITGSGKAFVAGADISAMADMTADEARKFSRFGQHVFNLIEHSDVPVIAAINGFALGGGCELAMACDIRWASEKAKLGQPEVNLGVIPGFCGTQRLPRFIGQGRALELLFTGNIIDAHTALSYGLVDKVLAPEELMPAVNELASTIASKCPQAVTFNKQAVKGGNYHYNVDIEAELFAGSFKSGNAKIGMKAFLEKTKPQWR
jgi:enoyl-CoA hydratase